jgi:hypothetical protein
LLRAYCEWPAGSNTAKERDEVPSPHHRATFQPENNNLPQP